MGRASKVGPKKRTMSRNRRRRARGTARKLDFGTGSAVSTTIRSSYGRPQKVRVKLPYTTYVNISTLTGATNAYLLNLNSLFDPDRTGLGHQPLAFDEWKAMGYTRYRVYGVSYDVSLVNNGTGAPVRCAVLAQNSVAPATNNDGFWEQAPDVRVIETLGHSVTRFKGYVDIAKLMGYTKEQYAANGLTQAFVTSDPGELCALYIAQQGLLTGGTIVVGHVKMTYYAELFDPAPLTISATGPPPEYEGPTEETS